MLRGGKKMGGTRCGAVREGGGRKKKKGMLVRWLFSVRRSSSFGCNGLHFEFEFVELLLEGALHVAGALGAVGGAITGCLDGRRSGRENTHAVTELPLLLIGQSARNQRRRRRRRRQPVGRRSVQRRCAEAGLVRHGHRRGRRRRVRLELVGAAAHRRSSRARTLLVVTVIRRRSRSGDFSHRHARVFPVPYIFADCRHDAFQLHNFVLQHVQIRLLRLVVGFQLVEIAGALGAQ